MNKSKMLSTIASTGKLIAFRLDTASPDPLEQIAIAIPISRPDKKTILLTLREYVDCLGDVSLLPAIAKASVFAGDFDAGAYSTATFLLVYAYERDVLRINAFPRLKDACEAMREDVVRTIAEAGLDDFDAEELEVDDGEAWLGPVSAYSNDGGNHDWSIFALLDDGNSSHAIKLTTAN